MKLAALLLVLLPSCAMVGQAVEGTGVATGAAVGAVVAGPAGAAAGGILGWWGGDKAAEALTDTRSLRVPTGSGSVGGGFGLGWVMDNFLWIALAAAFVYFGGLGWLKGQITKAKAEADAKLVTAKKEADEKLVQVQKEDAAWVSALDKARSEHRAETAALTAKVELLEKMLVQPRKP